MAPPHQPKVSVIIPAYNQAAYLGTALESVLDQRYYNWEVIVVNDASSDQTDAVVARYGDPRIRLIHHQDNRGLPAARNSGLRAATGELLMLLDADDCFHVDKMAAHVAFLERHPTVGVTYNARYEMNEVGAILTLWRPPTTITLTDLVCGFPFAPSDMVLRREWAFRVQLFDESYVSMSEDLDFNGRLALAGCPFAGIDRALNYRRYYSQRVIHNPMARHQAAERALENLFRHPACPPDVLALRKQALATTNLVWSYESFRAGLTQQGQRALRKAVLLEETLLANAAATLLEFFIDRSIQNGGDHAQALQEVMSQLPPEMLWLRNTTAWAISQADLRAGARAYLWGRTEQGQMYWQRAAAQGMRMEPALLHLLVDQLNNIRREVGVPAAQAALQTITQALPLIATTAAIRRLEGCYWLNQGLEQGKTGAYGQACSSLLQAFRKEPTYLRNRGAWATLGRAGRSWLPTWPKFTYTWSM